MRRAGLAEPLTSALDELVPVADEVGPLAEGLRGLAPQASEFLELADDVARTGNEPVALFAEGVKGQAARVRRDQIPALEELVHLVELIDKYKAGIVQFAESWSSALSVNRRAGPYTQVAIVNAEILPEGLGLTQGRDEERRRRALAPRADARRGARADLRGQPRRVPDPLQHPGPARGADHRRRRRGGGVAWTIEFQRSVR